MMRLKKTVFMILATLMFAGWIIPPGQASADTSLVNESFESTSTGALPWNWFAPLHSSNTSATVAASPAGNGTSTQSLKLYDNDTASYSDAYVRFPSQSQVTAEWKFYVGQTGKYEKMLLKSGSDLISSNSNVAVNIQTTATNGLAYVTRDVYGVETRHTIQTISSNTWYTVKVVVNLAVNPTTQTQTYDIYVNGTKMTTSKPADFYQTIPANAGLDVLYFSTLNGNTDTMYIDDVNISTTSPGAYSYSSIISKYYDLLQPLSAASSDPYVLNSINNLDTYTGSYSADIASGNGSWKSMNSVIPPNLPDDSVLSTMFNWLNTMAQSWATPGSAYYHSTTIQQQIISGLDQLTSTYYTTTGPAVPVFNGVYRNWYTYKIGIPYSILKIATLLNANSTTIPQDKMFTYMQAVDDHLPAPVSDGTGTGANLADYCTVSLLKGAFMQSAHEIWDVTNFTHITGNELIGYISSTAQPNGMYPEGSYIFHKGQYTRTDGSLSALLGIPYNGHYGVADFGAVINMVYLLQGTTWQLPQSDIDLMYDKFFKGFAPFMLDGKFALPVTGRFISSPSSNELFGVDYISMLGAAALLAELPSSTGQSAQVKGFLKQQILNAGTGAFSNAVMSLSTYFKLNAILGDTTLPPVTVSTGTYQYPQMDVSAYRGNGWFFINRMHSSRISNWEVVNDMGKRQWYTGDGATYVYTKPSDYLNNWIWAADMNRIPGTTEEYIPGLTGVDNNNTKYPSTKSFVGSVDLQGQYSAASMDFQQHDVQVPAGTVADDVYAKKSWFMFDNEVVALGAGIGVQTTGSGRHVETTIDNRVLNSQGTDAWTVNGVTYSTGLGTTSALGVKSIYLEGFGGYYFPDQPDLTISREARAEDPILNSSSSFSQSDSFDGSALNMASWLWLNEIAASHSYVPDGTGSNKVLIQTNNKQADGSIPNLLLQNVQDNNAVDYQVYMSLDFTPTAVGQAAGLMLYLDNTHYVTVSRTLTSSGLKLAIGNESGDQQLITDHVTGPVMLRMEKAGDSYTGKYSTDGTTWSLIGSITHPFTIAPGQTIRYGMYSVNSTTLTPNVSVPAYFDNFGVLKSGNFMSITLDHGVDAAASNSYKYVLLPTMTSSQVATYAPDFNVLSNTADLQAVQKPTLGVTGITFWNAAGGTLNMPNGDAYQANQASMMMVKDTGTALDISVSDPSQTATSMVFTVNRKPNTAIAPVADAGVTVDTTSDPNKFVITVSVSSSDSLGKTYHVKVNLLASVKPSVTTYVYDGTVATQTPNVLYVKNATTLNQGYNRISYIKFKTDSFRNGTISQALVSLTTKLMGSDPTRTISMYGVQTGWDVSTITWNTRPARTTTTPINQQVVVNSPLQTYTFDVTSYVNAHLNDSEIAFELVNEGTATATNDTEFYDYMGAQPPVLQLK